MYIWFHLKLDGISMRHFELNHHDILTVQFIKCRRNLFI